MKNLRPRLTRLVAAGAAGALLSVGLVALGAAPASAGPLNCDPATDGRSAVDRLPKAGVVIPLNFGGSVNYFKLGVDESSEPYDIVVSGLPETTRVVGVWENSTACDGNDLTRNAWAVTPRGAVFADGDIYGGAPANYFGGANTLPLQRPIVGMSATGTGDGYWMVAGDGGIFSFGDARFYGSTGNIRLNKPVVGMTTTPSARGYWMVASDGGIFAFGNAQFYGSTGNLTLNKPIIGMVATPTGKGYWLVASDGGVFTFGDAKFRGSLGGEQLSSPVRGLVPSGNGYVLFTDTDYYVF